MSELSKTRIFSLLNEALHYDMVLYYKGSFKKLPSVDIINIARANIGEQERRVLLRRVIFLLVEIIQNIERYSQHSDQYIDDLFATKTETGFIVTSRNVILAKNVEVLRAKIDGLNSAQQDELKAQYRKQLESSEIEPGKGAGLGLMEMVRKSKYPIAYQFEPINDELAYFQMTLRTPLRNDVEVDMTDHRVILQTERELHKGINSAFAYSGLFDNEFLTPLLDLIDKINMSENKADQAVYKHLSIEIIQNINKHAENIQNSKKGFVRLTNHDGHLMLCSSNFVSKHDEQILNEKIKRVNTASDEELSKMQVECITDENAEGGLGLLQISHYTRPNDIIWWIEQNNNELVYFISCKQNKKEWN